MIWLAFLASVQLASVQPLLLTAEVTQRGETRYLVRPSDDLTSVSVQAVFQDDVAVLTARDGDVRRLEGLKGCGEKPVRLSNNGILTDRLNGCLHYRYPLDPRSGRRTPAVREGVVVTAPSEWLWTPELDERDSIRIELSLPAATEASVPWRQIGPSTFELSRSPGSATGSAVFGRIDVQALALGGATLRVATVDGPGARLDRQKVLDWLNVAAQDVANVAGGFPNPSVQVIVQPATSVRSKSPVPFGYVVRDGGESVRFLVDPERSLEDYLNDWTATHEFSHLLLPYVRSREKWVSEGFASYYQNVLMARRGAYSETDAWNRLHRSFERARQVQNPPRLAGIDQRPFWEMRMLIYWSGAAMALLADSRLRSGSDGAESLDSVLARLRACCLPSGRAWRADELFTQLDALSPEPVFMDLYEKFMGTRGMPDLASLYHELGLKPKGETIQLSDEGRLVAVRKAIMARRGPTGVNPTNRSAE